METWDALKAPKTTEKVGGTERQRDPGLERGGGRAVACALCAERLAAPGAACEINGCHSHTCVNPAGLVFHIGCFRPVPGVDGNGPWSADWSWFAGHRWQIALCGGCGQHLGWLFSGADSSFVGLIESRIRELEDDPSSC